MNALPDSLKFDLNDITLEPSDEVLEALMQRVAEVAREKQRKTCEALLQNLQQAVNKSLAQTAAHD